MARGFLRDSLGFALSQYVARAAVLVRGLAAAAVLGPTGFGGWNALNLILDYGANASCGVFQGLDLELPPACGRGDRPGTRRMASAAWGIALGGGVLYSALVVAALSAGRWLPASGWGWGAPMLMLGAVFVHLALQYHASALRACGEFSAVSSGLAIQAVLGSAIGIAGVIRWGVWALLWGWLAGGLAALAWMRRSPMRPPLWPGGFALGASLVRRGFPLFAFFALTLALRSVDRLALVRYGGNGALGLYSLALIATGLVLYLPEAGAAVLFPRIAAAAGGARDPLQTREEVLRAQRALTLVLPLAVGVAVLCAPALVDWLLPAFREGIDALRALAGGALLVSSATLPSYYLLGTGRWGRLLGIAAVSAALTAGLTFGAAMRDPRPVVVAWAASAGYGVLALAILLAASFVLADRARDRLALLLQSLLPVGWGIGWILLLGRGSDASLPGTAVRVLVFLASQAPIVFVLSRSSALRRAVSSWLEGRFHAP